jgi:hypothetical protein
MAGGLALGIGGRRYGSVQGRRCSLFPPQCSKPLGFTADPTSDLMVQRHRCAVEAPVNRRVAVAFDELALAV